MRFFKQDKTASLHVSLFDNAGELAATTSQAVPERNNHITLDRSFVGRRFKAVAEAGDALNATWSDGLAILDRMRDELAGAALPQPRSRRRCLRWDEATGDELDYDRLRSGQAWWRTSRRDVVNGPASRTIVVDVGANCHVDAEDILWRGAAAIVLTEILEAAGYRVELWAAWKTSSCYHNGDGALVAAQLKGTADPLDPSTLVNAVSGWFFRTAFFQAVCLSASKAKGSLGHSREPSTDELDLVTTDPGRTIISGAWNYADAVALIRSQVNQLTGGK